MDKVRRFKPVINSSVYKAYAYCTEDADGLYVSHRDYAALQQKLDAALSEIILLKQGCENSPLLHEMIDWKERAVAMSVEMVALKKFCKNASFDADYIAELEMDRGGFTDALNDIKTPQTDAIINALRAEGVEYAANHMDSLSHNLMVSSTSLREYAAQLRNGEHAAKDGE